MTAENDWQDIPFAFLHDKLQGDDATEESRGEQPVILAVGVDL